MTDERLKEQKGKAKNYILKAKKSKEGVIEVEYRGDNIVIDKTDSSLGVVKSMRKVDDKYKDRFYELVTKRGKYGGKIKNPVELKKEKLKKALLPLKWVELIKVMWVGAEVDLIVGFIKTKEEVVNKAVEILAKSEKADRVLELIKDKNFPKNLEVTKNTTTFDNERSEVKTKH